MRRYLSPRPSTVLFLAMLLAALSSGVARAQEVATVEMIDRIKSENMLLEAQVSRAKLLSTLRESEPRTATAASQPLDLERFDFGLSADEPAVVTIIGLDGRLRAKLRLSNGHTIKVSRGDKVPGTPYTVASVTGKGVTVRNLSLEHDPSRYLPFLGVAAPSQVPGGSPYARPTGPDSSSKSQLIRRNP